MARKPTEKQKAKALDSMISDIYHRNCSGIEIMMMDIPKVFAEGKRAALSAELDGRDVVTAVTSAIVDFVQKIRKN